MRYIDVEPIKKQLEKISINAQTTFINTVLIGLLDEAPTADVVEVVRCKDCVLHNSCIPEETFNFSGIENPFCCVGKKVQNDL